MLQGAPSIARLTQHCNAYMWIWPCYCSAAHDHHNHKCWPCRACPRRSETRQLRSVQRSYQKPATPYDTLCLPANEDRWMLAAEFRATRVTSSSSSGRWQHHVGQAIARDLNAGLSSQALQTTGSSLEAVWPAGLQADWAAEELPSSGTWQMPVMRDRYDHCVIAVPRAEPSNCVLSSACTC